MKLIAPFFHFHMRNKSKSGEIGLIIFLTLRVCYNCASLCPIFNYYWKLNQFSRKRKLLSHFYMEWTVFETEKNLKMTIRKLASLIFYSWLSIMGFNFWTLSLFLLETWGIRLFAKHLTGILWEWGMRKIRWYFLMGSC